MSLNDLIESFFFHIWSDWKMSLKSFFSFVLCFDFLFWLFFWLLFALFFFVTIVIFVFSALSFFDHSSFFFRDCIDRFIFFLLICLLFRLFVVIVRLIKASAELRSTNDNDKICKCSEIDWKIRWNKIWQIENEIEFVNNC